MAMSYLCLWIKFLTMRAVKLLYKYLTVVICTVNLTTSKMEVHIGRKSIYVVQFGGPNTATVAFITFPKFVCWSSLLSNSLIDHPLPPLSSKPHYIPPPLPHSSILTPLTSTQLHWWSGICFQCSFSCEESCSIFPDFRVCWWQE